MSEFDVFLFPSGVHCCLVSTSQSPYLSNNDGNKTQNFDTVHAKARYIADVTALKKTYPSAGRRGETQHRSQKKTDYLELHTLQSGNNIRIFV
jgi:hypothetical protein